MHPHCICMSITGFHCAPTSIESSELGTGEMIILGNKKKQMNLLTQEKQVPNAMNKSQKLTSTQSIQNCNRSTTIFLNNASMDS